MEQAWVTRREREVMRLVAGGRTTAEIARRLGITANTVESHVRSVRTKLGVPTRTAAVAWLPAAADASRPPHRALARVGARADDRAPAGRVGSRRPAASSGGVVAAAGGLALDATVLGLVAAGGVAIDETVLDRALPTGGVAIDATVSDRAEQAGGVAIEAVVGGVATDPVVGGGGPASRAAAAGPWAGSGGRVKPVGGGGAGGGAHGGADGGEGDGPPSVGLDPVGSALLAALARGLPVTAAAREGHMSLRTAHRRLSDARHALGAATTAEAVARWCAAGGALTGRPDGSHPWRVGA